MKRITQILCLGFLLLFLSSLQLSAQNCTFSKNETDRFTNERVLYTKPVNIIEKKLKQKKVYNIEKIEMQIKYRNNTSVLALSFHFALGLTVANTNSKLILLLANGSKIEAPCLQNMPSQERKPNGLLILSYDFAITEEAFKELLEFDITDIRLTSQVNPIDFTISQKVNTSVLFNCINDNK
jgi:hypothetical protein